MSFSFETILGIIFFIVFFVLPAFSKKKPRDDEPTEGSPKDAGDGRAPGRTTAPGSGPVSGPARQPQGRPQASTSQPTRQAPTPQRTTARGGGSTPAGSVEEALEAIRQRVREAQEEEDARRSQRTGSSGRRADPAGTTTSQSRAGKGSSSGGSLVSGEARRIGDTGTTPPPPALGPEGSPPASMQPARPPWSSSGVPGTSLGAEGVSAPLQVTRRGRQRSGGSTREITDGASSARRRDTTLRLEGTVAARLGAPRLRTDRDSIVTGMIWHEILSEPAARKRLRRMRSPHQ